MQNFSQISSNSSMEQNLSISAYYFNSIGILQILITDLPEYLCDKLEDTKIMNKCDDGELKILLKFHGKEFCEFILFFSKSMSVKLQHTQIKISKSRRIIDIRYFTIKNLLNTEKILQSLEYFLLNYSLCFESIDENGTLPPSKIDLNNIFPLLHSINCKRCLTPILTGMEKANSKLAFNFNYDYIENLEMLSCHESDMKNVIPNLENELKRIINFTYFKVQIPQEIIDICNINNGNISSNCTLPSMTKDKNKFSKEIKCLQCDKKIGEIINKFFEFDISLVNFSSVDRRIVHLSMDEYIKTLVYYCVTQNKKVLTFLSGEDEKINLLINSSFLYSANQSIRLNTRAESIRTDKFVKTIYAEVIPTGQDVNSSVFEDIYTVQFLKEDFAEILKEIKLKNNELRYLIGFLNNNNDVTMPNSAKSDLNLNKDYYVIQLN